MGQLDQVNDDFSDFSLSSPARKIRRLVCNPLSFASLQFRFGFSSFFVLCSYPMSKFTMQDTQLPPIMEEEEVEFDSAQIQMNCNGPVIEELENQERAIVPFNPVNNPLFHNPSNVSVSLSPDLISGFKGKYPIPFWICF